MSYDIWLDYYGKTVFKPFCPSHIYLKLALSQSFLVY